MPTRARSSVIDPERTAGVTSIDTTADGSSVERLQLKVGELVFADATALARLERLPADRGVEVVPHTGSGGSKRRA